MHQIDNPWVATTKPPTQPVGTPGWFQPGDEATSLLATVVDYDWANTIQSELINVVVNAGLTPDKQNDAQLVNSIITIINREVGLATGGPYLPLAGGVMGGTIFSRAAAGTARALTSQTGTANRWITALADNSAENGGNTGSDWTLTRCDDSGNVIDVVMRCSRNTGAVDFPMGITYGSGIAGGGPSGGNLPTDPPTSVLNQNTTIYVNACGNSYGGNDTHDGLSPTTQLATLPGAWAKIRRMDLNGFTVTISLTTYDNPNGTAFPAAQGLICDSRLYGQTSPSQLILVSNGSANPPNFAVITAVTGAAVGVTGGAMLTLGTTTAGNGLSLSSTNAGPTNNGPSVGLWAQGAGSQIVVTTGQTLNFGPCQYAHTLADGGSIVFGTQAGGVSTISFTASGAGSMSHWHARNAGTIDLSLGMVNYSPAPVGVVIASNQGTPSAFAFAETGGKILAPDTGQSYPWNVKTGITGKRYQVDATGSITNTGAAINYLPGNAVGTVAPGGIYS
jgi:hypothetical protein